MTSKKNTRRALFTSIMSLILCFAMLMGTTFAWFTDSVTSGNNIINSGNLDVELYYGKDKNPTKKADGSADLFTDCNGNLIEKWEPGVVAYTNLKVANEGSLALKYQLAMNFTNFNYVEYADGSRYTMADVLKVAIVPNGFQGSRVDALDKNFAYTLSSFTQNGTLKADETTQTYGVIIYWEPGENDNLLNLKNGATSNDGKPLHIDLGISLFATQVENQNDSFDNTYDKNLEMPAVVAEVTTSQALKEALEAGKTAKLMADIVLSDSVEIDSDITAGLDLNGFTLTLTTPAAATFNLRSTPTSLLTVLGNLLIDDTSAGATGKIVAAEGSGTTIQVNSGANIIVNGGAIEATLNVAENTNIVIDSGASVSEINVADGATNVKLTYSGDTAPTLSGDYEKVVSVKGTGFEGIVQDPADARHYYIDSKAGLLNLNALLANIPHGEGNIITVDLNVDVDLSDVKWKPITSMWVTFNGNGHTISNINAGFDDDGRRSGFWGYAGAVTIKNLTLENVSVAGSQAGAFVGSADGTTITNCYLKGTNTVEFEAGVEDWNGIGAICGVLTNSNINVTIDEGASVLLVKDRFQTADGCTFVDNLTGYLNANNGNVVNNGTVSVATTTKDGLIMYTDGIDPNKVTLYKVTESYEGATLNVPEGVTDIGNYAFSYNSNVKEVILSSTVRDLGRGFDGSAVEKVVLNEGLTAISSRAFRETKQLKEVEISSTVKVIADNAFQKSGIKEIVIPANVETIGETAFGASLIESVTFKGNTSIQGYAFRGCKNLRTVVLNGEDVKFISSTLNNRDSCWFCNSESNNPNTSDIDFYVANATVAGLVKTAMGAEANNTDVFIMIDGAKDLMKKHGASQNEYIVTSAAGLAKLNTKMADKSLGRDVVVNLTNDIDFAGYTWTPVDSHADTAFTMKEINGNGHTISNLSINGQAMFTRFAGSGDVTIKDITFDKATVNSNGNINTSILTVQSYQNVLLDNVDVKNSTITGGYKVAPLIATVYNESPSAIKATLKNCDVENVTVKATSYDFCTTGMVAFVYADSNDTIAFENCTVSNVKLYAPNVYTAHAAIYTTGSETLFNEAEGVTVTNVNFENI